MEVVALDGQDESPPARAEVVIADTAPGPVAVALCDGPVPSGTVPEVRVTRPAADPDGDAVSYRYEWSLNGSVLPQAQQARLGVPLKKRDVVRVQVTPWDGELPGPPMVASCAGRNTPAHRARWRCSSRPRRPRSPASAVKIQKPATDADGDPVTYRYRWSRDGLPFALEGPSLPPRVAPARRGLARGGHGLRR